MSLYLGIDFGTSTLYITKWNEKKKMAEPVVNLAENNFIESAIYYQSATDHVLGRIAIEKGINQPLNLVQNVKRKFEDDNWLVRIESLNRELNATEISSDMFRYLKNEIEKLHGGQMIDGVVISVPFAFQNMERQKIKEAAENAGLNVMKLIEEPVAAAISFGLFSESIKTNKTEKILIFDLGGGTFDVTIFELNKISDSKIRVEVLNTDGHKNLGGKDIDEMIVHKFEEVLGFRLVDIENKKERQRNETKLYKTAKDLKETLSNTDCADAFCSDLYNRKVLDIEDITVDEFNEWLTNSGFLGKIKTVLENTLDEIDMEKSEIDRIVLVGGSSKIPAVQKLIEKFFGKKAEALKNTWELVGEGAGLYCGCILENSIDYEVITKISHAIGVKVQGGKFEALISRNKKYEEYSTPRRYKLKGNTTRGAKIEIYQGNSRDINKCSYVGTIQLQGDEFKDNTVDISLGTDANGIIKYRLIDIEKNVVKEGEV